MLRYYASLRSTLDATQYKHAVLGLLFVKYVSDAFEIRRKQLVKQFQDPAHEYFLNRKDYESDGAYHAEIKDELEIRDYYNEKNVFWVPELVRWRTLQITPRCRPAARSWLRTAIRPNDRACGFLGVYLIGLMLRAPMNLTVFKIKMTFASHFSPDRRVYANSAVFFYTVTPFWVTFRE
jgi:hypothetical protein